MRTMCEKICINFFLAVSVGGVVKANYYANSLDVLPVLKGRYPGCEVEVFNVKQYGFAFGDAPVIKVDGCTLHGIRCKDTGQTWRSAKACCEDIGVPLKTLYSAIRRGSRLYGQRYEYYDV